ncbi:MAG TPA: cysteine synthase family protein, partial [Euryarchaeota archaeon]|nr:cysteine synthase family protein [Euryarchaeota archaeon]
MEPVESILDLIGRTPMLRLKRLFPEGNILAKCEFMNPLSLKDRAVLRIIEDAEREGKLERGQTLIECTSGNTGMAVAMIGAVKGYPVILVMSEIQSLERRKVLKALGARLVLTPADKGTAGAREEMKRMLKEDPSLFYVGQHVNPSNPAAHYSTTGPEIWEQADGRIDILVAALGTGGTICGAGKYLKEMDPGIRTVAVEPEESPYISKGIFHPHRMMGTAPGFYPETLDRSLIDEIMLVSEEDAFSMCREVAGKEGILVGISSGAVIEASRRVAERFGGSKNIVCVLAYTGQRYLSVEGLF